MVCFRIPKFEGGDIFMQYGFIMFLDNQIGAYEGILNLKHTRNQCDV